MILRQQLSYNSSSWELISATIRLSRMALLDTLFVGDTVDVKVQPFARIYHTTYMVGFHFAKDDHRSVIRIITGYEWQTLYRFALVLK